jgi:glycosyltransferase involved in cell wall biosynthesis
MSNHKILLNFIPIKKGGGQQVATSFINVLSQNNLGQGFFFLVTSGTHIDNLLKELKFDNVVRINPGLLSRLYFEQIELKSIVVKYSIDLIFTMFGPGLPPVGVPAVVGCAYSNLFFPEIDFWKRNSYVKKLKLKLIDKFRLKRTLAANGIIFENEAMRNRAISLFDYPAKKCVFIKPSISIKKPDKQVTNQFILKPGFKILLLTGWHPNKNIDRVPYILNELKQLNPEALFNFVITVKNDDPQTIALMATAKQLGIDDHIECIGAITPEAVPALFDEVDAVLLISVLESFSNNIIEAWTYEKPLIISDLEWATEICKDAALYVPPDNEKEIAKRILNLYSDKEYYQTLVAKGSEQLLTYPDPVEKVELQLSFIDNLLQK